VTLYLAFIARRIALAKKPILSNSLKNNTKTVVAVLMMLMIIVGLGFVLASFCLDLGQIASSFRVSFCINASIISFGCCCEFGSQ